MSPPFTAEEFFGVFRAYNLAVWPAQVFLLLAGLLIVTLALRSRPLTDWLAGGLLGVLWAWTGTVYHLLFFSEVNKAAYVFAVGFVIQGALLLIAGPIEYRIRFRPKADAFGVVGGALVAYALVIYPVVGLALGHTFPSAPTFGVPCPVTIFTFGLLLWVEPRVPRSLLWIPAIWALIGTTAVRAYGMIEDVGMIVAAVTATAMILTRRSYATTAALGAGRSA
jgi:hypothetical protein